MSTNPGRYNLRGQRQNDPAPPGDFDSAPSPEGNRPSVTDPAPAGPEVIMPSGHSHESFGPGEYEAPPPIQGVALNSDASIGNAPESVRGSFLADVPTNTAPSKVAEKDVGVQEPMPRTSTPRNTSRISNTGPGSNNNNSTLDSEQLREWRATESERIEAKVRAESAKTQEQILVRIAELQEQFDSEKRDHSRGIKDEPHNVHMDDATKEHIREVRPKRKIMSTYKPANLVAPESHVARLFVQLHETTPRHNYPDEEPDPEGGSSNNEEETRLKPIMEMGGAGKAKWM
ncbi:hypothetical protein DFH05DRAFT_1457151 [Lentinula detonsa]|uniref:Uncharacterized protein n=1 Tax=Lentinula detonsa TaxID=2804962 RepID=A0A9W8P8W0_9AGAR|nr:hypothetical protein DFH05DRAFT_1457151 [Lentinula detonsa]